MWQDCTKSMDLPKIIMWIKYGEFYKYFTNELTVAKKTIYCDYLFFLFTITYVPRMRLIKPSM